MSAALSRERPIPFDFGEFSFRSLGVTLNFPKSLQRTPVGPTIFGFMVGGDTPESERLASLYRYVKDHPDPETAFVCHGYSSCLAHELRHYHDYLATPFGVSVMCVYILSLTNLPLQIADLHDLAAVVVPLQAWQNLSDAEYRALCAQEGLKLSRRPPENALKLNQFVTTALDAVRDLHATPPPAKEGLTTRHLLEASAMEAQGAQICALWGIDAVKSFCEMVRKLDHRRLYVATWDLFEEMNRRGGGKFHFSGTVRNALVFLALCVSFGEENEKPVLHPVDRFIALITYVMKRGYIPRDEDLLQFLDEAADALGLQRMEAALRKSIDFGRRLAFELRQDAAEMREKSKLQLVPEVTFDAFEEWLAAHELMVGRILAEPLKYFDPMRYFSNQKNWVAAPFYIAAEDELFDENSPYTQKWLARGWRPVWGWQRPPARGGRKSFELMWGPVPSLGERVFSDSSVSFLSSSIWTTYLLNGRGLLRRVHRDIGCQFVSRMLNNARIISL